MTGREKQGEVAFQILSNPETRDRLLRRMRQLTEQIHDRGIGALVFLDKSARPLAWMFSDLWRSSYRSEKIPDIRFLNLGATSFENAGAARRLIGDANRSDLWRVDEEVDKSMEGLDLEDPNQWLRPADVPAEWQKQIIERTGEIEELEALYRGSFDRKNVLIVDDIVSSGRSLLASLAVLDAAFPLADFQAAALFQSRGEGRNEDRNLIPWLSIPGMSGILEVPESRLISSRITEEDVERVRQVLQLKFVSFMEDVRLVTRRFEEAGREFKAVLESIREAIDPGLYADLMTETDAIAAVVREIKRTNMPNVVPHISFEEMHDRWLHADKLVRKALSGESLEAYTGVSVEFEMANPDFHFSYENAYTIADLLGKGGYESIEEMFLRARQLRAELKKLAKIQS